MAAPPPPHTTTYYDTKAEVVKRLGAVTAETVICLLITPHDHNGKRYIRRAIRDRETIYCDAQPLTQPTTNTPAKC